MKIFDINKNSDLSELEVVEFSKLHTVNLFTNKELQTLKRIHSVSHAISYNYVFFIEILNSYNLISKKNIIESFNVLMMGVNDLDNVKSPINYYVNNKAIAFNPIFLSCECTDSKVFNVSNYNISNLFIAFATDNQSLFKSIYTALLSSKINSNVIIKINTVHVIPEVSDVLTEFFTTVQIASSTVCNDNCVFLICLNFKKGVYLTHDKMIKLKSLYAVDLLANTKTNARHTSVNTKVANWSYTENLKNTKKENISNLLLTEFYEKI